MASLLLGAAGRESAAGRPGFRGDSLAAMTHGHIIQLWDLGLLHQELAKDGLGW